MIPFKDLEVGKTYIVLSQTNMVFFPHEKNDEYVKGILFSLRNDQNFSEEKKIQDKIWNNEAYIWSNFAPSNKTNIQYIFKKLFQ